jgi:hypothetical protein
MPTKKNNVNDGSDKNKYENENNQKMINLAVNGVTLLREELIDEFRDALFPPSGSEKKFLAVCTKAKIDPKVAEDLYKGLTKGFADPDKDVWV